MKRSRRNNRNNRRGGGSGSGIFGGILIGMIIAVAAVAALMWYINNQQAKFQPQAKKNDSEYQRPQRPTTPPATEIIRPQDSGVATLPPTETPTNTSTPVTPVAPVSAPVSTTELDKNPSKEVAKKEEPKKDNDDALGDFIRQKDKEKAQLAQKKAEQQQNDDILGNLISDIDRKNNNRQPENTQKTAKAPQKSVFKPLVEGKSVLQAGSFATQEQAESQRAKLSMMGIQTHIETAVKDGKTYYRVRSGSIDTEQAYALKKRLADNQTDSIVIPYR